MSSDTSPPDATHAPRVPGRLVGLAATVRPVHPQPSYFTALHRSVVGKTGRVHAIVPTAHKSDPLVKVGFDEGTQIVFFHLADLEIHDDRAPEHPQRHGRRGSHLPKRV
jgi:hypothetical protein